MEAGDWIALGGTVITALGVIGGALAWVINLISAQSKDTISTLRDERDYWRTEARDCRDRTQEGGVG